MDYQNLNETFNTMPALQTSNEYFSDISSRTGAIRPKTVMDYDPERINNKKKSKDDKIDNNEFQEIFDYNHQKSESMSTLQELNKKYNLGLKSFSGFMDSGLLRNSDDRDQVKVFESQNYENLKSYKIGGNLEYGNFLKKSFENKIDELENYEEKSEKSSIIKENKENVPDNEQELSTIDKRKSNIFHEYDSTHRKPLNLKPETLDEPIEPKDLSYATSFGNLLKEAPKSVDENSTDQYKKRRVEQFESQNEWSKQKKSKSERSVDFEDEEIQSRKSDDWAPSALHTDPTTPVVQERGKFITDFTVGEAKNEEVKNQKNVEKNFSEEIGFKKKSK